MIAYYNENDPKAAAWLRELIKVRLIQDGEVDERSIDEVSATELMGYRQCHFFAGIGGWAYALRLAGWPDDRPVWTGSCPCQPFSVAGRGRGYDDERHLWPIWSRLIAECEPSVVFGEQVASKAGRSWLAAVRAEMEAMGYGLGGADLCAAGVGAPHIRQRLWFVAERLGDTRGEGLPERISDRRVQREAMGAQQGQAAKRGGDTGGPADSERLERQECISGHRQSDSPQRSGASMEPTGLCGASKGPSPTNGIWADADWLFCRDGKSRPVEPGTFPLVARLSGGMGHGRDSSVSGDSSATAEARVMRLRGYGNAIVPQVAAQVIGAFMEFEA